MTRKVKDGCRHEFQERGKPANTLLTIGSIRIPVERETYLAWEAKLRVACSFDAELMKADIKRRLGL
jgi:hypothetical protein